MRAANQPESWRVEYWFTRVNDKIVPTCACTIRPIKMTWFELSGTEQLLSAKAEALITASDPILLDRREQIAVGRDTEAHEAMVRCWSSILRLQFLRGSLAAAKQTRRC
jgi:hypothetical protein